MSPSSFLIPRTLGRSQFAAAQGNRAGPRRCRLKFLHYFPGGFTDPRYLDWERGYKWAAHQRWEELLGRTAFSRLLAAGEGRRIAQLAVQIESRTNLLFSFEKMAVRDAVRTAEGADAFARGLFDLLHGAGGLHARFDRWCAAVEELPRRQTRVLTWPVVTVFGFLAQPQRHLYLKPTVTKIAAEKYGFELGYGPMPSWEGYKRLLAFGEAVRRELADLAPRDMIDVQSFLWVLGSEEYPDL